MKIAVGDPEWPFFDAYLYGRPLRGVLEADDEDQTLRIALFDAEGKMIRAPGGAPVEAVLRAPVRWRKARTVPDQEHPKRSRG